MSKIADLQPHFTYNITLGADPEFFFKTVDGKTVGSEKFIPIGEKGLGTLGPLPAYYTAEEKAAAIRTQSKVIVDGVQAELNPQEATCRQTVAGNITACMRKIKETLAANGKGIVADFRQSTVDVTAEELASLNENSRKFGCAPSQNAHDAKATITVDPEKYLKRSAGGHIHLSIYGNVTGSVTKTLHEAVFVERHKDVVRILDIILGNTSVLMDRDPGNIERRKNYGYAGEYRLPKHGLEYRTLSNFWLQGVPLQSFVMGMARQAVEIVCDIQKPSAYEALIEAVDMADIVKAINTNDFDLALSNWNKIEPIMLQITPANGRYCIDRKTIERFAHFIARIKSDGMQYWLPTDPLVHWTDANDGRYWGFQAFLEKFVQPDLTKYLADLAAPKQLVIGAPKKSGT